MKNRRFAVILAAVWAGAFCCLSAPTVFAQEPAEVDPHSPYRVLRYDDYVRLTGCKVFKDAYNKSLQTALNYLVFRDDHLPGDELLSNANEDIDYAQRHSAELFGGLLTGNDIGIPSFCVHSSLARIGKDIGFPIKKDGGLYSSWDAVTAAPPLAVDSSVHISEFEILSRPDYMATTGCLVSPATYHKFHLAFFQHILGWGFESDAAQAAENMRAFLQDIYAGRATPEGAFLHPSCLIPAISRLAMDLNLLDQNGQFANADDGSRIFGDFNGDGVQDQVYFAQKSAGAKWQLTVSFGSEDEVETLMSLPEYTPNVPLKEIMIYTEPQSVYPTVCYQMPEDCTPELPEQIETTTTGIIVAVLDEPAVLVYWDKASGRFLRHRIID